MKNLIFIVLLSVVFNGPALAKSSAVAAQFIAGNHEAVEKHFSAMQKKFESGAATEYELLDAYKIFYAKEDVYRNQFKAWIGSYPDSPYAYLARGIYFRKLGENRRGNKYIRQTPEENLRYMQKMHELAKKDLGVSLHLNEKSYLSALHLLNIAQFQGDDRAADEYLEMANRLLPSNFIARARYLVHLTPRWGGSYELMDEFIERCRREGMPQKGIDRLKAIKLDDQGFVLHESGDIGRAYPTYVAALKLAKPSGRRFRDDYLGYSLQVCRRQPHASADYCQ